MIIFIGKESHEMSAAYSQRHKLCSPVCSVVCMMKYTKIVWMFPRFCTAQAHFEMTTHLKTSHCGSLKYKWQRTSSQTRYLLNLTDTNCKFVLGAQYEHNSLKVCTIQQFHAYLIGLMVPFLVLLHAWQSLSKSHFKSSILGNIQMVPAEGPEVSYWHWRKKWQKRNLSFIWGKEKTKV